MAVQCSPLVYYSRKPHCPKHLPSSPPPPLQFSSHRFSTSRICRFLINYHSVKSSTRRRSSRTRVASSVLSHEKTMSSSTSVSGSFKLTFLEGNSWLWDVGGLKFLVDPVLVGNLNFGLPWLYNGAKKVLKSFQLSDLPEVDILLITQSLDDHCHLATLKPISEMLKDIKVIATPNAKAKLDPLFKCVKYLEPGEIFELATGSGSKLKVKATAGPVLGAPWQRPENGYLIKSSQGQSSLYYEPHCVYNKAHLEGEQADIVITPVIKQRLPKFTLVYGQEDAVQLAKQLNAKYVVPMNNGELDTKGLLATILYSEGTVNSFKELLAKEVPEAKVLEPTPGVPLVIAAALSIP